MKEIALLTYTNSNLRDVWPVYFGQLSKHLKEIKSYIFSDKDTGSGSIHTHIIYNNEDPYHIQYVSCLESVKEDFVIYSQEDFILYDDVTAQSLQHYCEFLDSTDYSFVKLIRSGYNTSLNQSVGDNLYAIDVKSNDAFSMQAILWKKNKLHELYCHVKSEKWYESETWNMGCRNLDIRGVFVYNDEKQRGKFHYDSSTFPYVCTALNKGLWNLNEYPEILGNILKDYNVDPADRGFRIYYGQVRM